MASVSIMHLSNWISPFEIMYDAKDYVVGAMLGQKKDRKMHVIYYAHRTLDDAQINHVTM